MAAALQIVSHASPVQYQRYPLPDGDGATANTIRMMRGLAEGSEGARSPIVRETALNVLRAAGVANRDYASEIAALFAWQQHAIQFRGEVAETIQSPEVTLHLGAGDCDDHVVLLAALLHSIGRQVRFITIAADPAAPSEFSHVYVEALNPATGEWVPLDTTVDGAAPGWQPGRAFRRRAWQPLGDSVGQDAYNLLQPLDQAVAQRIAYPSGTLLFGGHGQVGFNTGLPNNFPWGWLLLGAGALYFVSKVRR